MLVGLVLDLVDAGRIVGDGKTDSSMHRSGRARQYNLTLPHLSQKPSSQMHLQKCVIYCAYHPASPTV